MWINKFSLKILCDRMIAFVQKKKKHLVKEYAV